MLFKEFSYLGRIDRRMVVWLAVIAVIAALLFLGVGEKTPTPLAKGGDSTEMRRTDSMPMRQKHYKGKPRKTELFYFDPNTADRNTLLRLGLKSWQVRNIYKYRARGGIFRNADDFAKLYGLTAGQFRQLKPYIRISPDFLPASTLLDKQKKEEGRKTEHFSEPAYFAYKLKKGETIPLNASDTAALQRVPGIGSYFARKICELRGMLGGFYSKEQLMEIDRFPESALPYFQVNKEDIKPLEINRLTYSQLRRHPYINYLQARAITDYRRLYGDIKSLETLRFLTQFTDKDIERLAPYIKF